MQRSIPKHESLTVEFKSDRERLSDDDLVEAAVCLANSEGGEIYVGVEDDGSVTGLHETHRDPRGLAALVANRTVPPLSVRAETVETRGQSIVVVTVPRSRRIVATSGGVIKRRRLTHDGRPQCVPFLPHEFTTRESDLGQIDYSALTVAGASTDDLDPVERARLRRMIERHGGDGALLDLDDESLDGALGLVRAEGNVRTPTVLGLLLLGKESALRDHIPTHEVAFQVLDGEDVVVNEFVRRPLLRTFEWLEDRFEARLEEKEVQVGLFRVPIPTVDRRAFREAVANALTHRDYTRRGAVHVKWTDEAVTISNPGGFVEGVHLYNLLTVDPRPRNPILADAFKRLGLVERTGRGVDLIYRGLLRFGRPAPDYTDSDENTVKVRLSTESADIDFLELVLEQEERRGATLPVDSLITLSVLRSERRVDTRRVAEAIQKNEVAARRTLEALVEQGLVEAHGAKRGRSYTLSAGVYQRRGEEAEFVRQAGFDEIQQEEMVRRYVETHGEIRRSDAARLCRISDSQATRLLAKLQERDVLERKGQGRGTHYVAGPRIENRSR